MEELNNNIPTDLDEVQPDNNKLEITEEPTKTEETNKTIEQLENVMNKINKYQKRLMRYQHKIDKYFRNTTELPLPLPEPDIISEKSESSTNYSNLEYKIFNKVSILDLLSTLATDFDNDHNQITTLMHKTVLTQNFILLDSLLNNGFRIDYINCHGDSSLHLACSKGLAQMVSKLLENGANINLQNNNGLTPLMLAVKNHRQLCYERLIEYSDKIDFTLTDKQHRSLLYYVLLNDKETILKKLVELEVDLELIDDNDISPIIFCAKHNSSKCINELTKYNINVNVKDKSSLMNTALHYACKNTNIYIVRQLLLAGADITTTNNEGDTVLTYMLKNEIKDMDIIRLLLNSGSNIHHKNKYGEDALILAVNNNFTNLVQLLINNGANVNTTNSAGITPVMIATKNEFKESLKLLLNNNADPTLKSIENKSAIDFAKEDKNEVFVHTLRKYKRNSLMIKK